MTGQRPKPTRTRNKNGCICCRVRRKNCDGERPTCGNCERHGLICSWPAVQPTTSNAAGVRLIARKHESGSSDNGDTSQGSHSNIEAIHLNSDKPYTKEAMQTLLANANISAIMRRYTRSWRASSVSPVKYTGDDHGSLDVLFQHYVEHTAPKMISSSYHRDSFLSCVLPLATSEPVLMSTLLALSSSHIMHRTRDPRFQEIATKYYSSATRGLRKDLIAYSRTPTSSLNRILSLLAATLILYQYESVSGRPGTVGRFHLFASRELVKSILTQHISACSDVNVGYLLDLHAYYVIVGNITPHNPSRIPADEAIEYITSSRGQSDRYSTLACGTGLFEIIPLLCRTQESEQRMTNATYESLKQNVTNWNIPDPPTDREWTEDQVNAVRAYQIALSIYLHYVFCRRSTTWSVFIEQTQPLILDYFNTSIKVLGMPAASTMMWPFLVVVSFIKDTFLQTLICSAFKEAGFDFALVDRAVQVLQLTWSVSSEERYGLDALDLAVKELDFCMG